jgi:Chromo (CHRromatin Organisation MOdifier) domain
VEKVVDKRLNAEKNRFQYLVKYKKWGNVCNSWKNPEDISDSSLVREFELQRIKLVEEKRHIAAWYPFGEELVVQWHDHPFFILSHGGGQINKFCVVGVNRAGTALICKHAHHPNHPQHQVHIQLVEKEMKNLNLCLRNKIIRSAFDVQPMVDSTIKVKWVDKPASTTPICLTGAEAAQVKRLAHYSGSSAVPKEFKPAGHPRFCKCETLVTAEGTEKWCSTSYKPTPDLYNKGTTLWLTQGPPVTDCRA